MGGKSGGTKINQYYGGFHYVLCRGPIDKLTRFTSDDKIAWEGEVTDNTTINVDAKQLYGGENSEGGITGAMDIMFGGPTQTVNSYLASVLSGKLVPAYRTVVSAVLRKFYVGQNPYIKKIGFRMQRIHVRQDGVTQWYDEKSQIMQIPADVFIGDLKFPATSAAIGPYAGVLINSGFTASDILIVRKPKGLTYGAWSYWSDDDDPRAEGKPWCNGFWVTDDQGVTKTYWTGPIDEENAATDRYATIEGAEDAHLNDIVYLTGSSSYTFWIYDTPPSDNRGGLSIECYKAGSVPDMNPAHMVRECLTDPDWGMGYQDSDVNDSDSSGNLAPFQKAADTLFDEQMGMSLEWNTDGTIDDFVQNICDHVDAAVYVDRRTGQFQMRLIRDDYDVDSLLELNPDNVAAVTDYDQPVFGELVNSITVNFTDLSTTPATDGSVTEQDTALASAQGAVIDKEKDYKGFTNATLASRVALRDLTAASGQPISCKVQANRDAEDLTLGMCFKLTWPDFKMSKMVMRITGISYGDGKSNRIVITCTQDKFRLMNQGTVTPTQPGHEDTIQAPVPVVRRLAIEMPYVELIQAYGQSTVDQTIDATPEGGFVSCTGARPQGSAQSADMQDNPGSGYRRVGTMYFCPSAVLAADIAQGYSQLTVTISAPIDMDGDVGAWCQIDDEIFPVVSVTETSITIKRAAMDTVPAKHLTGALVFFPDDFLTSDTEQFVDGTSVGVKMLTNTAAGQLPIASASEDVVAVAGRAALPYPPGLVRVAGAAYPATVSDTFTITWAHRNRLTQSDTLVAADAASITPAPNTRYGLQFYDSTDTLLIERTDIGPATASVVLNYTGDVIMRLYTIDDNGASLYQHEIKFAYTPPAGTVVSTITATAYTPVDDSTIIDGGGDS